MVCRITYNLHMLVSVILPTTYFCRSGQEDWRRTPQAESSVISSWASTDPRRETTNTRAGDNIIIIGALNTTTRRDEYFDI